MKFSIIYVVISFCTPILDATPLESGYKHFDYIDGSIDLNYHLLPTDWHDARHRCEVEGGTLASPVNKFMLKAMVMTMNELKAYNRPVFTGIQATDYKEDFFSIEGVPFANIPADWSLYEPSNIDSNETCLVLDSSGTLSNVRCNNAYNYICYKINISMLALNVACGDDGETANANEIKTKLIFGIDKPVWIFKSGMSKGKYHDRQDLGFILRENTVLKARQTDPEFKENLVLRLLGDDLTIEKTALIGPTWTTISADYPLVPFIDTPYDTISATLEYIVESNVIQKPLPVFRGDERSYRLLDVCDAEYTLVKGNHFQLLLPKLKNNQENSIKSLQYIIERYDDLIKYYDEMAGFNDSSKINKNGNSRYFLKTDTSSHVNAYYNETWAAINNSLWQNDIWKLNQVIALGYQAAFDSQGILCNLFPAQYLFFKKGKVPYLYDYIFYDGHKDFVDKELHQELYFYNRTFSTIETRKKLLLLTMLTQKAGTEAVSKMHQGYRKFANKLKFIEEDHKLPDLLNHYYSEHSHLDFTPVLEKWKVSLTNGQPELNRANGYPAVASLTDIVTESYLKRAREITDPDIPINSIFQIVENSEIANLGLKGSLVLKFKKSYYLKEVIGSYIQIKKGKKFITKKKITDNSLIFDELPNGVYTMKFISDNHRIILRDRYAYVKEAHNQMEISFDKLNLNAFTSVVDQTTTIRFLGISNCFFAALKITKNEAIFWLNDTKPHYYFIKDLYARVTIKDGSDTIKYDKTINGTNSEIGTDNIALRERDTIIIYHAETGFRLKSDEKMLDLTSNTNTLKFTKWGLYNTKLQKEPDFVQKIRAKANYVFQHEILSKIPFDESRDKKVIYMAIQSLEDPYLSDLMYAYGYDKITFN